MSSTTLDRSAGAGQIPDRDRSTSRGRGRLAGLARFVVHQLPTVIVFVSLAALGAFGHFSHWKLPKFSSLLGTAPPARADWCEEHGVPESVCVECSPDLMPKGPDYGWCQEHGVHNCPLHHPDVAQVKETPIVTDADLQRAAHALALEQRKENNSVCRVYQRRLQFASLDAVKQAGVDIELVDRQPISEWVAGSGEITYDQTRFANLSSRVAGTIWRVRKNVGDRVQAGEVVAIVDAMLVGQAKGELVDALVQEGLQKKTIDRLQTLRDGTIAGRQIVEAEAAYEKAQVRVLGAQQTLANLGLPIDVTSLRSVAREEQIARLRRLGVEDTIDAAGEFGLTTANLLPIRSPLDGVVVDRKVVAGEVVDSSNVLLQVADTSRMWLTLNVPIEQAGKLALGQAVRFRSDGKQQEVSGILSWISTAADTHTRMVRVRADLSNPDGRLLDETFGGGRIILREEPEAIVVPNEAVQWEGCCHVIFVRDKHYFDSPESPKVFHVRSVRVGAKNGKFTEIIAGVLSGEVVATKGSDVLRAQLLKNSLGEGCTCGQ